jgi:predicted 3-demethylubiquinone-9 3-methyltransferase (glyoxalase superfamily)
MSKFQQVIIPNLWFDRQAEEAAQLYISLMPDSKIGNVTRAGKAGFETHGLPEGTVMTLEFQVGGLNFIAINGGPIFKFTPAISFMISCNTPGEVDYIWSKLAPGGSPLMDLGSYPFSERYGWIQDCYGLSWQVFYNGGQPLNQKITPTLMFTGQQWTRAEKAINFYTAIFPNSHIGEIMRYQTGEEPDKEGTVRHAAFHLDNQEFAAMDSAQPHLFGFNEAISLMVPCADQAQIDYYWDKLIGDGGKESNCGWLKDPFGVSWQVCPTVLSELLRDPDPEKVARVTGAFLAMYKFDISTLEKAYRG